MTRSTTTTATQMLAAAVLLLPLLLATPALAQPAAPAEHPNPLTTVDPDAEHLDEAHAAADGHGDEPALIPGISEGLVSALTTLVIFLLLLAVLGKFAWGPIVSGLRQREERIRRDIADAEAARARAEATLREYSTKLEQAEAQIREMMAKANADAERVAAGIRARGQQEAEESKERAMRDIDAARTQAVGQVREEAANLATFAASKILRRELRPEDQRDLVNRSLDELQTINNGKGQAVAPAAGRV